jgi:hypothetical protein
VVVRIAPARPIQPGHMQSCPFSSQCRPAPNDELLSLADQPNAPVSRAGALPITVSMLRSRAPVSRQPRALSDTSPAMRSERSAAAASQTGPPTSCMTSVTARRSTASITASTASAAPPRKLTRPVGRELRPLPGASTVTHRYSSASSSSKSRI